MMRLVDCCTTRTVRPTTVEAMKYHVLLGALASFASFAQGKVLSGVIKLDGEVPEHYISKVGYSLHIRFLSYHSCG